MDKNRSKQIRRYIGDDGELLQPLPASAVTEDNDDLGDFVGERRIVHYYPGETRSARLKRWWGRVWLPILLFFLCIAAWPVTVGLYILFENWFN